MSENKSGPLFGIGGVTLLTVLLVLCLTLFSVLALSSAQADLRLSEKNARMVTAYYTAENQVYDLIKQVETIWPEAGRRPTISALIRVFSGASQTQEVTVEPEGDNVLITLDVLVQENSILRVTLYLRAEAGVHASRWEIRQWQTLPPTQSEADVAFLPLFIP